MAFVPQHTSSTIYNNTAHCGPGVLEVIRSGISPTPHSDKNGQNERFSNYPLHSSRYGNQISDFFLSLNSSFHEEDVGVLKFLYR